MASALETLTVDGDSDGGLGLLLAVLGHARVDASVVHVGLVDNEGGCFFRAAHRDVLPVGEDLLSTGVEPVDVFDLSNHWGKENEESGGTLLGSPQPHDDIFPQ